MKEVIYAKYKYAFPPICSLDQSYQTQCDDFSEDSISFQLQPEQPQHDEGYFGQINELLQQCELDYSESSQEQWVQQARDQNTSQFPYTQHDSNNLYKNIRNHEDFYNHYYLQEQISHGLQYMKQFGFDFRHGSDLDSEQNCSQSQHKLVRKVFCAFKCKRKSCPKQWTSKLGCLQTIFRIKALDEELFFESQNLKYPYIVQWKTQLRSQKCKYCKTQSRPYIYKSQIEGYKVDFCRVLADSLNNLYAIKNKRGRGFNQGEQELRGDQLHGMPTKRLYLQ